MPGASIEVEEPAELSGAGIGLAVCRRLVEARGGTIHFEPTAGGGATFVARWAVPA